MTLNDHIQQIYKLISDNPEAANMQLAQSSCFDRPLRFETNELYIGEAWDVVDEDDEVHVTFDNDCDAQTRADEENMSIRSRNVVVVGAN